MTTTAKRTLQRVLVANRGEIAMRIVYAARELGIQTVGVFSDADENLPHLAACDETVRLGPSPASESYLAMDRLIAVATETGCDCLHPGYGFLAENAEFARRVEAAGIVWIGPHPEAIEAMGDKIGAKELARRHGVPVIDGFIVDPTDPERMIAEAERVGYPLLVKPTAGGGGKGMYVVREPAELVATLEKSTHDAQKSFGRGGLLVERYLEKPRHIEIQVLGDRYGQIVHLGERECSIQRRHQKLIEETPSPFLDDRLREKIAAAGVAAAKSVGYTSAGTVECLVDASTREFFFLEMNTRLQVEHPVTEQVTRMDLCKAMFRIAAGESLWFSQSDVRFVGHSIECRIIAEDPFENFMPSFGRIKEMVKPGGPAVRVDSGFTAGNELTHFYDSLLAKLVTWGSTRDEAIERMLRALDEFHIIGPQTCIPFHKAMLADADFRAGDFTVHTCERKLKDGLLAKTDAQFDTVAALALALDALDIRPRMTAGPNGALSAADASSASTSSSSFHTGKNPADRDEWRHSGRPGTSPGHRWGR